MARYIEETEIYKLVEPHGTAKVHCSQIDELPRADVVPKSEYARLEKAFNELIQEAKGYLNRVYGIRADVASEIFAEIEKQIIFNTYGIATISDKTFAELKKKYTEGEDKPASEEKHFSPEDVRNMTPQEVREKYTAIRKSMEKW